MNFRYVAIINGKAYFKEDFEKVFQKELDIVKKGHETVLVGKARRELYDNMKFDWYIKKTLLINHQAFLSGNILYLA